MIVITLLNLSDSDYIDGALQSEWEWTGEWRHHCALPTGIRKDRSWNIENRSTGKLHETIENCKIEVICGKMAK
jgi:hypothetical protein